MKDVFIGKYEEIFDRDIIGSFGNFKTADSYELYYLMTTIRLDKINWLTTASQSLSLSAITFNELIQRDIDYKRVDTEIVEKYLQKGKDRVIFFPPLLATLLIAKNGIPIEQYTSVDEDIIAEGKLKTFIKTWDKDKFKLLLPISEENTGYSLDTKTKGKVDYYHHAARIAYNSNAAKLVVIDGQHRLTAIQRIIDKAGVQILPDIKIPLCIFFTPNAVKGSGTKENVKYEMRDLFVTINNKSKQVSGHFIVLLDDKSLSSIATRDLADFWKGEKDDYSDCYLHLLEWNQREHRRSSQLNRVYSVTTVNIIAEALKKYIFDDGKTSLMLNLVSVQDELRKKEDCPDYGSIDEETFCLEQIDKLTNQIHKYITPALHILLSKPSPYSKKDEEFRKALDILNEKIDKNIIEAKTFRDDVLFQFRDCTDYDSNYVKTVEKEFNEYFKNEEEYEFFFKNANLFQSALINAWVILCNELMIDNPLDPIMIAESLVRSLEVICFKQGKRIFDPYREYTQNIIFKGQKIKVSDTSRNDTANLLIGSLINEEVRKVFITSIDKSKVTDVKEFADKIKTLSHNSLVEYFEDFDESTFKRIKKEWRLMDLDGAKANKIETLEKLAKKGKDEDVAAFEKEINSITKKFSEKAKTTLSNLFEIKKEVLA